MDFSGISERQFTSRLRELRLEAGLTQKQLAEKMHLTPGMISDWEIGKTEMRLSVLVDLAKFFDVSVDYLCGLADC